MLQAAAAECSSQSNQCGDLFQYGDGSGTSEQGNRRMLQRILYKIQSTQRVEGRRKPNVICSKIWVEVITKPRVKDGFLVALGGGFNANTLQVLIISILGAFMATDYLNLLPTALHKSLNRIRHLTLP
ncbi:unnamed protein product [Camellia sinensis]